MKQEIGPNQRKWLDALRSGDYKQAYHGLCFKSLDGSPGLEYCCLGVACEVFGVKREEKAGRFWFGDNLDSTGTAPTEVTDALGLYDYCGQADARRAHNKSALTQLNDDERKTFSRIADIIEADPAVYFREAR